MGTGCVLTPSVHFKMSEDMSTGGCKRSAAESTSPPSKKCKTESEMDIKKEELSSGQKGVIVAPKLNDAVQIKVSTKIEEDTMSRGAASVQRKTKFQEELADAVLLDLKKKYTEVINHTCPLKKQIADTIMELESAKKAQEASNQQHETADQNNDNDSVKCEKQHPNKPKPCNCHISHSLFVLGLLTSIRDELIEGGFLNVAKVSDKFLGGMGVEFLKTGNN